MNLFTRPSMTRHGISIIEVLTSIVVAMIGVFGVMILIPFAVKQAKTGLDSDAATVVARNASAQFEIAGYRNTGTWITTETPLTAADPTIPQMFSIDPLAITENGRNYVNTTFPFNRAPVNLNAVNQYPAAMPPMANYVINPANLLMPNGFAMTVADARRMFRTADDLVFGDSISTGLGDDPALNGPQQIFDSNGALALRRQSVGGISWSAIVVPVKDNFVSANVSAWKYRMYVLVYKDRVTSLLDLENRMITAKLDETINTGMASPLSTVYLEDTTVTFDDGAIGKDDWVMLINQDTSKQEGFQHQLAFCRVVGYSNGDGGSIRPSLTLDGPDFDFGAGGGIDRTNAYRAPERCGWCLRTDFHS